MLRFTPYILALAVWLLAAPAGATITYLQQNNATGDASATTIAVTLTSVASGSLVVCWAKHEGTATTITMSDGTSSFTMDTYQSHANNDLGGALGYLLSSVATGSVTYTATFGAAKPLRRIFCWEYSHTQAVSFDTSARNTTDATSITSGSFTTTGSSAVIVAGYGEYAITTLSNCQVNGVAADHCVQNAAGSWDRIVSGTFTGAATATISVSSGYIVNAAVFKEASPTIIGCLLHQDGTSKFLAQNGTDGVLLQGGASGACIAGGGGATVIPARMLLGVGL